MQQEQSNQRSTDLRETSSKVIGEPSSEMHKRHAFSHTDSLKGGLVFDGSKEKEGLIEKSPYNPKDVAQKERKVKCHFYVKLKFCKRQMWLRFCLNKDLPLKDFEIVF